MRVLITGAQGFLGKNLSVQLGELGHEVLPFVRGDEPGSLAERASRADAVLHLAGVNRPQEADEYRSINLGLTETLCRAIESTHRPIPLILASSTQAALDNPYGRSKLAAEHCVEQFAQGRANPVTIYRLPGVFGKWCRPDYNSVVATFCHRIARGEPIRISDRATHITLAYVDDVASAMIDSLSELTPGVQRKRVAPEYCVSLGDLADQLNAFASGRSELLTERVGQGWLRALYATYISHLPVDQFIYDLPAHADARGVFVEMLKTPDCGQFSYFSAHPGVTRGGHYHHTKTEKFLVLKGHARFRFRHILTQETHALETRGEQPQIVESIPGWAHDITNIGHDEMFVMLWANERFDRQRPDTITLEA